MFIEPPAGRMPADATLNTKILWLFRGYSAKTLSTFLEGAGIDHAQVPLWLSTATEADGGIVLKPDADLVRDLPPRVRGIIYDELARWPQNIPQCKPFRIRPDQVADWLSGKGLPPSTDALVEKLLYPKGPFLLFADAPVVLRAIPSADERREFVRVLYRQATLLPKLYVSPDADLESLVHYWGAHGREDEVRPLIESLARSGGGDIDIGLLLPPFARERLFDYQMDAQNRFEDCTWSSMNFLLPVPDDRFSDEEYTRQVTDRDYAPVTDACRLGDIIILRNANSGEVVHACNFIADDIVFTKNGGAKFRPWVLMHLKDVVDYYSMKGPVELRAIRLKK